MEKQNKIPSLLLSRLTTTAIFAAQRAGEILKQGFGTVFQIDSKEGSHNLVTEYDQIVENEIIDFIKAHFPDHVFLAEESGSTGENSQAIQWIIDPLDGTVNFAHSIPMFSVSIAAAFNNEILCGVVFQPLLNELFVAEKGQGAFLNGSKLHVTKTNVLDSALVGTGFPYNIQENPRHCIEHFLHFCKLGTPLRRIGSAALDLAYLAAGRFDAFWEVSLQPWDYAAGKLLVEEAGGKFSNFDGESYTKLTEGAIAASNTILHDKLINHLKIKEEK